MNSKWRRKTFISAVIVMAPLVIGGCGSGGSGGDTTAALSKSQLLKKGNEICSKGLEEKDAAVKAGLEQLPEKERFNPSAAALAKLGETVIPPYQKLTTELSNLSGLKGDEAALDKITAELEAALKRAEADPARLAKVDLFRKAGKAAKAYGFSACNF
jgi:hypothetical protein